MHKNNYGLLWRLKLCAYTSHGMTATSTRSHVPIWHALQLCFVMCNLRREIWQNVQQSEQIEIKMLSQREIEVLQSIEKMTKMAYTKTIRNCEQHTIAYVIAFQSSAQNRLSAVDKFCRLTERISVHRFLVDPNISNLNWYVRRSKIRMRFTVSVKFLLKCCVCQLEKCVFRIRLSHAAPQKCISASSKCLGNLFVYIQISFGFIYYSFLCVLSSFLCCKYKKMVDCCVASLSARAALPFSVWQTCELSTHTATRK